MTEKEIENLKNDWRYDTGKTHWDVGETLKHAKRRGTEQWDHDHCTFCWKNFSNAPEDLHEGYCDLDEYSWICEECFNDFKEVFEFRVLLNPDESKPNWKVEEYQRDGKTILHKVINNEEETAMKSKVYFTRETSPEAVLRMYKLLGVELTGRVAIKVHSGEVGNQNFLRPPFWKPVVDYVGGTVVECNTAYDGERDTTEKHLKAIEKHGWNEHFNFDLMDAEGPDLVLDIPNGKVIKKNYVGKNLQNYDSMLVLSHFKGHPMGGYGGALKQLSIGIASSYGKAYIHGSGNTEQNIWAAPHDAFLESMADAASSVIEFFEGRIAYVNVMMNMSVDCDCCDVAEDPCMRDIGILVSSDPVAIDQACLDLVYAATDDPGQKHFLQRVESRNGVHTIEAAAALGYGSREYELIEV